MRKGMLRIAAADACLACALSLGFTCRCQRAAPCRSPSRRAVRWPSCCGPEPALLSASPRLVERVHDARLHDARARRDALARRGRRHAPRRRGSETVQLPPRPRGCCSRAEHGMLLLSCGARGARDSSLAERAERAEHEIISCGVRSTGCRSSFFGARARRDALSGRSRRYPSLRAWPSATTRRCVPARPALQERFTVRASAPRPPGTI